MAVEAPRVHFFCGSRLKLENLGLVSAPIDVGLPWTMATLAGLPLWTFLRIQSSYEVRRILKMLEEVLGWHVRVASLASLGADVQRGIGGPRISLFIRFLARTLWLGLSTHRTYCSREKTRKDNTDCAGFLPLDTHYSSSAHPPSALTPAACEVKACFIPSL